MRRRKEVVMRLDRYALILGIAALSMTGCSTGRYASVPVADSSDAVTRASEYDTDPMPEPYREVVLPVPTTPEPQPDVILPLPLASEDTPVKSVGLMSILSQTNKRQCVQEPRTPSVNWDSPSTCVAPEYPCCPRPVECAQPSSCFSPRKKSLFSCWHWPTKQTLCDPQPSCTASSETCCTSQPDCFAPEPQSCVTDQSCCEPNGCGDDGRRQGIMAYVRDRLLWKPQPNCSPQPACVDECTTECGDRGNNTYSPLFPQCRNAPFRPSHAASPLAPCLEDPFVEDEKSTPPERPTDAPDNATVPRVPTAPEFNIDTPRKAQGALPVPQADRTVDPIPLSSMRRYVAPQTHIGLQIWPQLKVAPVVNDRGSSETYPTSWSR